MIQEIILAYFTFRFLFYAFRWQLSTFILGYVIKKFPKLGPCQQAFVSNAAGAVIFFPIDLFLFSKINF